jgi:hypothetical protein
LDDRWPAAEALALPIFLGGKHLLVAFGQHAIPDGHACLL